MSSEPEDDSHSAKRQCLDPDATPLARRFAAPATNPAPARTPSSSGNGSTFGYEDGSSGFGGGKRSQSGRSSPTKKFIMTQYENIIEMQSFLGFAALPVVLEDFIPHLEDFSKRTAIMAEDDMAAVAEATKAQPEFASLFRNILRSRTAVDASNERARLGMLPPISDLVDIWDDARVRHSSGDSEAEWNCAVHWPLLRAALRNSVVNLDSAQGGQRSKVKTDVRNITAAQIFGLCVPASDTGKYEKRVDFYTFIQPRDPDHAVLITRILGECTASRH